MQIKKAVKEHTHIKKETIINNSHATRVDTQCQRPVRPDLTDLLQISQDHADLADLAAKDYQCQPSAMQLQPYGS